jgi:lactoylglutathione lyase
MTTSPPEDLGPKRMGLQGIEPEKPPYSVREGGSLIALVRDPDGILVELVSELSA